MKMASEEPKTPEKEDSSLEFSTPLTSKKSINSSVIQLAFKKKLLSNVRLGVLLFVQAIICVW